MQLNSNNLYVPYTFFFKKLNSAKCNYKIYNKEILAVI